MSRERIVTANEHSTDPTDPAPGAAPRPQTLEQFVGQAQLRERLAIALSAAKTRSDSMEHVLLHGPPGLGKTTIAHIVAQEMGTTAFVTSGPALTKGADLVGTLTRMQPGDVLFIDEIHRLPAAVEEYIYPAMEDFKIDFTLDGGNARAGRDVSTQTIHAHWCHHAGRPAYRRSAKSLRYCSPA